MMRMASVPLVDNPYFFQHELRNLAQQLHFVHLQARTPLFDHPLKVLQR
jgi:hypothetical protein